MHPAVLTRVIHLVQPLSEPAAARQNTGRQPHNPDLFDPRGSRRPRQAASELPQFAVFPGAPGRFPARPSGSHQRGHRTWPGAAHQQGKAYLFPLVVAAARSRSKASVYRRCTSAQLSTW